MKEAVHILPESALDINGLQGGEGAHVLGLKGRKSCLLKKGGTLHKKRRVPA